MLSWGVDKSTAREFRTVSRVFSLFLSMSQVKLMGILLRPVFVHLRMFHPHKKFSCTKISICFAFRIGHRKVSQFQEDYHSSHNNIQRKGRCKFTKKPSDRWSITCHKNPRAPSALSRPLNVLRRLMRFSPKTRGSFEAVITPPGHKCVLINLE